MGLDGFIGFAIVFSCKKITDYAKIPVDTRTDYAYNRSIATGDAPTQEDLIMSYQFAGGLYSTENKCAVAIWLHWLCGDGDAHAALDSLRGGNLEALVDEMLADWADQPNPPLVDWASENDENEEKTDIGQTINGVGRAALLATALDAIKELEKQAQDKEMKNQ